MAKTSDEYYIFTFGWNQPHENHYVKIFGSYKDAREKMVQKYGNRWSMQYEGKKWEQWEKEESLHIPVENLLEVIE